MIAKNIFLYHLDYELQKLFALKRSYGFEDIYNCFNSVTRLAYLLSTDSILIPASNYFESEISFRIINSLYALNSFGYIKLISSSYNLSELLEKKINQHGDNIELSSYHYKDFLCSESSITLPGTLVKRKNSASKDIKNAWIDSVGKNPLWNEIFNMSKYKNSSRFENEIYLVPARLGEKAYISEYIVPLLPIKKEFFNKIDNYINEFITREYILSFLKEYDAVCMKNIPLIDSARILPDDSNFSTSHISYKYFAEILNYKKYKNNLALNYINTCTDYQLIEFKYSDLWKEIIEEYIVKEATIDNKNSKINGSIKVKAMEKGDGKMQYENVKIGIITALPKEFAAVKILLDNCKEVYFNGKGAGNRFSIGEVNSLDGGKHTVVLGMCNMGNNNAAIRASDMISHFPNINSIIMSGIAGGVPCPEKVDEHVRLGDIVISNEKGVTQYDFVKETNKSIEIRCNHKSPSSQLLEAVNMLMAAEYEKHFPWQKYLDILLESLEITRPADKKDILHSKDGNIVNHPLDKHRNAYPRVFQGAIASANILLKNPEKRDDLGKRYGVKAIEMEASGIADATWNHDVGYMVVRGICDYCDAYKNDEWQVYAASVAAAYTVALIEAIPAKTIF